MVALCLWHHANRRTALTGDVVIQPLSKADNSVSDYMNRRIRWLRVRKYMVLLATLGEPTIESIVCGIYGTFAISTLSQRRWFNCSFFCVHMITWMLMDYVQYYKFVEIIADSGSKVSWLKKSQLSPSKRKFWEWAYIWIWREILAFPIWIIALMGHEIDWRQKPFKINHGLTAESL